MVSKITQILYAGLIKPIDPDEDIQRREFILNIILTASIVMLLILDLRVLHDSIKEGAAYPGVSFPLFSLIVLAFIGLLFLSRKGYSGIAAHGLIVIYITSASYAAFIWGANLQQALLGYVAIIAISSILISTLYSFIITGFISTIVLVLWQLQIKGIITPKWFWNFPLQPHHAFEFVILFFLITTVLWLSNREIARSLLRARLSEQALLKQKDLLEEKVEERTEELKRVQLAKISELYKFAEFGKLSSGIFHDMVNPLTAMSLSMETIQDSVTDDIRENVEHSIKIVKRVGQFISACQKQLKSQEIKQYFDPSIEARDAITLLGYKAKKANVDIHISDEFVGYLYGNSVKFFQIVQNLVSNAIDACEVSSGSTKYCRVILKRDDANQQLVLKITDSGAGIHSEHLDKIFEPFFTTKAIDKGTGIGLSMTKQIIESEFKGCIKVISKPTIGTSFTIIIPLTHESDNNQGQITSNIMLEHPYDRSAA